MYGSLLYHGQTSNKQKESKNPMPNFKIRKRHNLHFDILLF